MSNTESYDSYRTTLVTFIIISYYFIQNENNTIKYINVYPWNMKVKSQRGANHKLSLAAPQELVVGGGAQRQVGPVIVPSCGLFEAGEELVPVAVPGVEAAKRRGVHQ